MRFAVVALAASLAVPATAQTDAPAPKAGKPAAEKKICRREVATSSRLDVKRTCRTRAEWEALEGTYRGDVRRSIDVGRAGSAG